MRVSEKSFEKQALQYSCPMGQFEGLIGASFGSGRASRVRPGFLCPLEVLGVEDA
jgi:hypothetical protein